METSTRQDFLTLQGWLGDRTEGLGNLFTETPDPTDVVLASEARLAKLPPRTQAALSHARRNWPRANPAARACERGEQTFVPISDRRYPARLREIPDPPPWLFVRGDTRCLASPAVAIVGSRRASRAGLQAAGDIARGLASAGYSVCSGLALGVDAAAHRAALERGTTVAVLASGVDRPSPRGHITLARTIAERGCLLSELPDGTAPERHRFPRRNRIISGLAHTTIIVEAALPSGTLHTATAALEQGRDVLVLPWSIYHRGGAGCLRLLRDGAVPLTSIDDLASHFPALDRVAATGRRGPGGDAGRILTLLGDAHLGIDEISAELAMDLGPLLVLLGELEVAGWLVREDGRYGCKPKEIL